MNVSYRRWKQLLIFCMGLALGTGFCMKWLEDGFIVNGEKFTMMGLELFYPKERMMSILSNLDHHAATSLSYHLHFDFAFMAGIFPGVSALLMMAREKVSSISLKKLLFVMSAIQLLAWACDLTEDLYLLRWLHDPQIGDEFMLYRLIVVTKWVIALCGVCLAAGVLIMTRMKKTI